MLRRLDLTRFWPVGLVVALLVGAVLRLVWVEDMEYKADEIYMFEQTQKVGRDEPWLGMESGVALRNPGMSVWVFLLLAKVTGAEEPMALCRAVMVLNIAAIVLAVAFAFKSVPTGEREPWLWGAALVSVNAVAVHFHRKIWAQSVLPFFSIIFLICWWHRDRRWAAFAWGLIGACLGQIHMSGFFMAAGFTGWAVLSDRPRVRWRYWLLGSCLAALPMIPWLRYLLTRGLQDAEASGAMSGLATLAFWRHSVGESLGLNLLYPLGDDLPDFLRYPLAAGYPTYLVLVIFILIAAAVIAIVALAGLRVWRDRQNFRALWVGRSSRTAFTQNAAFWGYGILLTAANVVIYPHYLIITFPLTFVWLARQALGPATAEAGTAKRGRRLLAALWVVELLLTIQFLGYIHVNNGTPHFDGTTYGPAYHTRDSASNRSSSE